MSSSQATLTPEFLTAITSNTATPGQSTQSQDDDNLTTMSQTYAVLTRCWRYERGSTLLLPYPSEFLNPIQKHIAHVEAMIMDKEIPDELQCGLYELEIERLRYIYNDLHRIRLRKIEQHPLYYAYDKNGKAKLSPAELEFAKGYAKLTMGLMKHGFDGLPGKFGSESLNFESPASDHVVMLHYLPKIPHERQLEVPNQTRPLYPNTLIVVPYEECNEWIQQGDFDVL